MQQKQTFGVKSQLDLRIQGTEQGKKTGENDGAVFRSSWNDGMQKLEIIWKKSEKVQAEAIVSKFEINGKDKKIAA